MISPLNQTSGFFPRNKVVFVRIALQLVVFVVFVVAGLSLLIHLTVPASFHCCFVSFYRNT